VAERRALLMHHYYYGQREIPAKKLMLRREAVERSSTRIGHDKKFHLPPISSEITLQSSVNVAKSIWNALPAETVSTPNHRCSRIQGEVIDLRVVSAKNDFQASNTKLVIGKWL
jgi:hypothetical protein